MARCCCRIKAEPQAPKTMMGQVVELGDLSGGLYTLPRGRWLGRQQRSLPSSTPPGLIWHRWCAPTSAASPGAGLRPQGLLWLWARWAATARTCCRGLLWRCAPPRHAALARPEAQAAAHTNMVDVIPVCDAAKVFIELVAEAWAHMCISVNKRECVVCRLTRQHPRAHSMWLC